GDVQKCVSANGVLTIGPGGNEGLGACDKVQGGSHWVHLDWRDIYKVYTEQLSIESLFEGIEMMLNLVASFVRGLAHRVTKLYNLSGHFAIAYALCRNQCTVIGLVWVTFGATHMPPSVEQWGETPTFPAGTTWQGTQLMYKVGLQKLGAAMKCDER
ncbi:hypothetical protein FOL47_000597, partial [Perkinsus chesapeaki]